MTGTLTQVADTGDRGARDLPRLGDELRLLVRLVVDPVQSMSRLCSAGASPSSSLIRCAPAPETDWYVATWTLLSRPRRGAAEHAGERDRAAVGVATMRSRSSASSARPGSPRARRADPSTSGTRRTCRRRLRRPRRVWTSSGSPRPDREQAQVEIPCGSDSGVASSTTSSSSPYRTACRPIVRANARTLS